MARVYRLTIKGHQSNGALFEPSLHYQTDLSFIGDEPDPDDVASGLWTLLGTQFRAITPTDATVDEVIAVEEVLKPAVATGGAHAVNAAGTWTPTGGQQSFGVAPVINRHTATRSRSARGWFFGPSPGYATLSGATGWQQSGTYWTNLAALAAKLDDSYDLGTIDITHVHPVVYSRTRHERGQTPYVFRVTSGSVNPQVRWLKSRLSSP